MKRRGVILAAVLLMGVLSVPGLSSVRAQGNDPTTLSEEMAQLIHEVRVATVPYHDLDTALEAGYGKFLDCFRHGEHMGMGQHYVNGDLASDDVVDPTQPEALVYEPLGDGTMALVAYEYLVFADVWDPDGEGREPPSLYGQEFSLKTNIPETPPVWALHIWLWSHNPEGLFADFNPLVVCPSGEPSVDMAAS